MSYYMICEVENNEGNDWDYYSLPVDRRTYQEWCAGRPDRAYNDRPDGCIAIVDIVPGRPDPLYRPNPDHWRQRQIDQ